jgi:atypical dual specificity phosphatase
VSDGADHRENVLQMRNFSASFDQNVVLDSIDLSIPARGAFVVLGHGGAGKSTLIRTLAGYNEAQPSFRTWGEVLYLGRPLTRTSAPAIVTQNARLLVSTVAENLCFALPGRTRLAPREQREIVSSRLGEFGLESLAGQLDVNILELPLDAQRRIAVARTALSDPALIMVDEPTADLDEAGRRAVLDIVAREAKRRAVLYVTHNRADALELGGTMALLVRGRVVEVAPTERFFAAPVTEPGRRLVENGTCYMTRGELGVKTPHVRADVPAPRGPRGFHWIRPGLLAGMSRPGLLEDLDVDLEALHAVGARVVVNLEETVSVPEAALAAHGFTSVRLPIKDMGVPSFQDAATLAQRVIAYMADGTCVAIHCRAGLGRTGTLLAAVLVYEGFTALDAIERVRRVQPRFVQSQSQAEFLERFERFIRSGRHLARGTSITPTR